MNLSVIIACFNGENTLADQFDGLAAQVWSKPWEVIFVDNGSTDGSRRVAEAYRDRLPNLKFVDASEKRGKAFALNKGAAAATGESLAFADADDQVAPGWLAAIGDALEEHDLVATRCDVETLNQNELRAYRNSLQTAGPQAIHYPPYLPHAGGGTIGIRRDLHTRVGGFDESLLILEDTDYVWKAQLAGATFHFVPEAVMRVRFRSTLAGIYRQKRNYAEYNILLSKRYRATGTPPPHPWRSYWRNWKNLLRGIKGLRHAAARANWVGQLGTMVGKTKGILKHRVPPV